MALVLAPLAQRTAIKGIGDIGPVARVIFSKINAVHDAGQTIGPAAEQPVQPMAILGLLDLLGIAFADRCNPVREI
ncbi:hypothetical protein SDC9_185832 [bioreactor metagenome]|uniref:Uncharacterized protein n=1 Tax=bioreactor metagenome TaxID=1076179 RepID=A0A645HGZ5_9ZZZZ